MYVYTQSISWYKPPQLMNTYYVYLIKNHSLYQNNTEQILSMKIKCDYFSRNKFIKYF